MKHAALPPFLPHAVCPRRCVFCDRQAVSKSALPRDPEGSLRRAVPGLEPGAQSMCGRVPALSDRGHTAAHTIRAMRLLKKEPVETALQFMPGLPGDTPQTIRRIGQGRSNLQYPEQKYQIPIQIRGI